MKHNSTIYCFLLFVFMHAHTIVKAQAVNVTDSLALVDLYNSTNGPSWFNNVNWLTKKPVKKWYGITVTGTRVTEILLAGNQLSGPIPSSFGNLAELTNLSLGYNQLTDSLPSSIGDLSALTYLYFYHNQLSGTIPSSIGNLVNLTNLNLSTNQLSGTIPSSISNLAELTNLDLSGNHLSGTIPSSIGNLVNLQSLALNYNRLSGSIPSSIGNLVNLTNLYLDNNRLSGSIPASIGNLVNLFILNLSNNQLSGSIPASIGNLENPLLNLYLNNNRLTGDIPASFKKLKFQYFDLSYNLLTESSNVKLFTHAVIYGFLNNNYFTFNGLESVAMHVNIEIAYAPQAAIAIHQGINVLSVSAGGTLSNNTYKWFSTGSKDSTTIIGDSTFHPLKNGMYYAHVTNAIATKLTLYTDTVNYTMPLAQSEMSAIDTKAINNHFSVYPNPARDIIHVTVNGMADVMITNTSGKIMLIKNIDNSGTINVNNLATGTYYIQNKITGEVQKIEVVH